MICHSNKPVCEREDSEALAMLLPHCKNLHCNSVELKMGEELTAAKQKLYLDCMFHSACNDLNGLLVKDTNSLGVSGCGC